MEERSHRCSTSSTKLSKAYWEWRLYCKNYSSDISHFDGAKRVMEVVGRLNIYRAHEYNSIKSAIDETQRFLKGRGYFDCGNLSEYISDMMVLIIYARRDIFNHEKGSQEYKYGIFNVIGMYTWIFRGHGKLFIKVELVAYKYLLLGKLLVIAGYKAYDVFDSSYKNEADYYYKTLNIKKILEQETE